MEKESFEGCSVIFHDIKECYSSRELVTCQFSIKEGIEISNLGDCCIGIFPVGWTSPQNCVTQKAFSAAVIVSERDFKLEFASSETKSSNFDDFFQFCFYNSSNGVIYGASCPFQICDLKDMVSFVKDHQEEMSKSSNTTQEEWWLDELQQSMDGNDSCDDIVLVHNKTTLLEESLGKAFQDNELLRNRLAAMEREHSELQEDLAIEKQKYKNDLSEFSSMKVKIKALQNQEVSLKDTIKGSEDVIAYLTNQMEAMKSKMAAEYEEKIQCDADMNKKLILSLESKVQENEDLSVELKDCKLDFTMQLSETKKFYEEEKKSLLEEKEKLKSLIQDQTKKYQSLEQDYKIESETYVGRILALEKALHTKTIANNQSVETELALQKLSTENKKLHEENELFKGKIVEFEQEITNAESKNNILKLDKNHLEEVVSDLQKSIGISQKEKEEIKQKFSVITTEMTSKDMYIRSSAGRILALEKALQTKTISNNQTVETELALEKLSTENKKLHEENELFKGKIVEFEQEITNAESKNNILKLDKNHLEEVVSDLQKSIGISQKETEEIKQKLSVITTEMTSKDMYICSSKETFEVMKNEIQDLNLKITREKKVNKELLEKISNFESQSEKHHSLPEHGSHHALQVASAHMQKQIRAIKAEKDKFQELYFNLKANCASSSKCDEKLKRENQELRTRLCLGKKDFDELAEKYKMLQRVGPPDILDNQV